MANEFKHKDPGVTITQSEYIASDGTGHIFDSQASGDILYASSTTVLARLAKATDGNVLELASGLPAWTASPTIGSTSWANANHAHAASNSGGTLTTLGTVTTGVWNGTAIGSSYIAGDAITGAKIADNAIDSEHYTDGSIDTAHIANLQITTGLIAADAITAAKIADDALDSEHYTDGSIDNAHLADDAVDSDEIAAGAIDTAHIADNQVTAAKLADVARGSILYGNASAATAELTKGSANTVLTSDGTDISWAAAGGGSLTLINTAAASNSATLTVTGLDTSVYDTFIIALSDLVPADNKDLRFLIGDSGGIDDGSTDYECHTQIVASTSTSYSSIANTSIGFIPLSSDVGNDAGDGLSALLVLNNADSSTMRPTISGTVAYLTDSENVVGGSVVGQRKAVITVTQVQVKFSTGNITTGRMTVWGVAHA